LQTKFWIKQTASEEVKPKIILFAIFSSTTEFKFHPKINKQNMPTHVITFKIN